MLPIERTSIPNKTSGFRKVIGEEFTDIYVMDLGSDVRRNPKISGTTHNVFGIQTGVAIGFFVRDKEKLGNGTIHYAYREDSEVAKDKLEFLGACGINQVGFQEIRPDRRHDWLNQANSDFERLIPLADRQTKMARTATAEQAVFGLHSVGISTNRDEWVYDFGAAGLTSKVQYFCETYEDDADRYSIEQPDRDSLSNWVNKSIKWTSELEAHLASTVSRKSYYHKGDQVGLSKIS